MNANPRTAQSAPERSRRERPELTLGLLDGIFERRDLDNLLTLLAPASDVRAHLRRRGHKSRSNAWWRRQAATTHIAALFLDPDGCGWRPGRSEHHRQP
ncbi:hypothetical protein QEZ54_08790 [Catellatospora sp. KI3]|uniref:hypothetical protein n=1 Tax=Catellatospora sp. KI3 TaxID=3041620 RepID=UPI0024824968|nr:hypothetical protein [Catellatospora sp. KI3]MDI1461058.1 hypothetical protein [Catellatospora sp. KI3]